MSYEATYEVGDVWVFSLPAPEGSTLAVTVLDPTGDSTTPTPVVEDGEATISVSLLEAGRYLAVVTVTTDGVPDVTPFTAWAEEPGGHVPTMEDVREYLDGTGGTSAEDQTIQAALDAERAAQARICNIPDTYPADLAEALCRRVARNLAARAMPIAQITSFDSGQMVNRVPRTDPEVIRLEGPFLKVVIG